MNFEQLPILSSKDKEVAKIKEEFEQKESKEISPEIFGRIKEDFNDGKCGYQIFTKIKHGATFKEYHSKEELEEGMAFAEFVPKMPEDFKKFFNFPCNQNLFKNLPTNLIKWDKYGNVAFIISPLEMNKQQLTLRDVGVKEDDKIMRLIVSYSLDNSQYIEKRAMSADISFLIRKNFADQLLDEIKKNPDNIWSFVKTIEPELLNVAPPAKKSYYEKAQGIAVFKEDKEGKIGYYGEPTEVLKFQENQKLTNNLETKQEQQDIKKQDEAKIVQIRKEIEEMTQKENPILSKEEFIKKQLKDLPFNKGNAVLFIGNQKYRVPSEKNIYDIEEKGFLFKKYIVKGKKWSDKENEVVAEFKNKEELQKFLEEELYRKVKSDLERIYEEEFG